MGEQSNPVPDPKTGYLPYWQQQLRLLEAHNIPHDAKACQICKTILNNSASLRDIVKILKGSTDIDFVPNQIGVPVPVQSPSDKPVGSVRVNIKTSRDKRRQPK